MKLLWIVVLLLSSSHTVAQFKKLTAVTLDSAATYAAVDRPGELYILHGNKFQKYSEEGEVQEHGSLPFAPTLFDPRDGSRCFAANSAANQFIFFSPYNFSDAPSTVDSAFAISPVMTCSSGDYDLLTLDSADWSLKKINLKTNRVLYETVLGTKVSTLPKLALMREYQNFVFMLDQSQGIYIFNMIGNLLQFLPAKDLRYFAFLGEELYYLEDSTLVFFDLFTTETRRQKIPGPADFALLTDQRLYLIRDQKLEVFSVKP
jgi:hypothetical protein